MSLTFIPWKAILVKHRLTIEFDTREALEAFAWSLCAGGCEEHISDAMYEKLDGMLATWNYWGPTRKEGWLSDDTIRIETIEQYDDDD